MKAWLFALGGVGLYLGMAVMAMVTLYNHEVARPIIRGLLWPISIKFWQCLFGG